MRKQIIIAVLFLGSTLCSFAQNQSTFSADKDAIAEKQIKDLEFFLAELIEKGDINTYSGYLTDDYIRVSANGVVSTKEQVLDAFRKIKTQGKMTPHDLVVRVYGNTAILRAILDLETKSGDVVTKRTSIITKVFLKRNGKWYMASLQGTPLQ
jgi:ketosteroid isomerase-like protein